MELAKLKMEDVKSFDKSKSKEVEEEIRKQLVDMRLNYLVDRSATSGREKLLRKSLARVLTARSSERKLRK